MLKPFFLFAPCRGAINVVFIAPLQGAEKEGNIYPKLRGLRRPCLGLWLSIPYRDNGGYAAICMTCMIIGYAAE
jgi:hypothetical protein